MKKAFFAVCVIGALSQLGFSENSDIKLINGKPVTKGTFKEVVTTHWDGFHCTSTIVGPRVVLTAAHCAEPKRNYFVFIQ